MATPEDFGIDVHEVAKDLYFEGQPDGFPLEGFDFDQVQLPPADDLGIPSDDDELDEEEITTESGFGNVNVVGGLPKVPEEKYEKLMSVLRKVFSAMGTIREGGLYMPIDAQKVTKGFAFIEYNENEEAAAAKERLNGYKLDRSHTFVVTMFDDFDKYAKVPEEYQPPEVKEYQAQDNLYDWLMDKMGRDQFVIKHGDDVSIFWNDGKRCRADECYKRGFWTDSGLLWSHQGTLLATVHRQGVAVWGGPNFARIQRFNHPSVRLLQFSPNDKYMITFNTQEPTNPRESTMLLLNVFDVRSGRKLRFFHGPMDDFAHGAGAGKWPVFKWAGGPEDLFFARLGKNMISIYQCPDMTLLDKKSLKMDGVQDFEWSPSDPVLAAYTIEQGNLPARISLVKIPERTELRQKNLFSVSEVTIYWHPQGDYLAVKVDRFTKTKRSTYTGFELFSIRERDIPMEVLELPNKVEKVFHFAWEPKGHRFAIIHAEMMYSSRPNISFYSMKDDKGRVGVKHLGTLPSRTCDTLAWSPGGRVVVLGGLKGMSGNLEFFNVDEFETMATAEHFAAGAMEWDPTGRYLATYVTKETMENALTLWSLGGKQLYTMSKDRFQMFKWRPRMPSLLPADKEAEVVKKLKEYSKRYDEEDTALLDKADAEVLAERQRLTDDYTNWFATKKEKVEQYQKFFAEVYGPLAGEREYSMESVVVEHILEQKEEPYNPN